MTNTDKWGAFVLGMGACVLAAYSTFAVENKAPVSFVRRTLHARNAAGDEISVVDSGGTATAVARCFRNDDIVTIITSARHVVDSPIQQPPDGYELFAITYALAQDATADEKYDVPVFVAGLNENDNAVLVTTEDIKYKKYKYCEAEEDVPVIVRGFPEGGGPATMRGRNLTDVMAFDGVNGYLLDTHVTYGVSGALVIREDKDCVSGMIMGIDGATKSFAIATESGPLEELVSNVMNEPSKEYDELMTESPAIYNLQGVKK